jgi:hypothetical protein
LLLIDTDRRLQSSNAIDIGSFQLIDELPCVARQALQELPLSLGEKSIDGERTFTAAAHSCNHNQFSTWDIDIQIPQIMSSRSANLDLGTDWKNA